MPLHALLIGINNYHPESNVPALLGCANDVAVVNEFLLQQFSEKERSIATLVNEEATYENIIAHFGAEHLLKANKGDTVLVHFSGHGARGFSALEFKAYYPDGMDENLVCYDSRLPGKYDLADKELAVLIERLAIKEIDVIILLDCCHSGSGTRSSADLKIAASREWEDREIVRPLESYLNGHYNSDLYIPNSRHLLLAACEKRQKAYELSNNQGVFTTNLLEVLNEQNAKISYADLYEQTRIRMRRISKEQSPQFEAFGYFNVHRHFLKKEEDPVQNYSLSYQNDSWTVAAGALQGLGTSVDEISSFAIYNNKNKIGNAKTINVQLEESTITSTVKLEESETYHAQLISIPKPPVAVAVHYEEGQSPKNDSDEKGYPEGLHKALLKHKPLYFELCEEGVSSPFQLHVHSKGLTLIQTSDQKVLGKLPDKDQFAYLTIFERLEHICQFEKTRNLGRGVESKNSDVKLLLKLLDDNGMVTEKLEELSSTIDLHKEDGIIQKVEYRVEAENKSKKAQYICLLHFSQNYGVKAIYNEEVPAASTVIMMKKDERKKNYCFDLKKKAKAKEYFKLIVSNKKINGHLLEQEELKIETLRGTGKRKGKGTEGLEQWYALDIELCLTSS
ncbi:MAG: hypothetical protein ACI8YQ_000659 [Polaribacter sp.]|jgi:hypothetical protein